MTLEEARKLKRYDRVRYPQVGSDAACDGTVMDVIGSTVTIKWHDGLRVGVRTDCGTWEDRLRIWWGDITKL